jgi:hypothetical protein
MCWLFSVSVLTVSAQKVYFIYIQSESGQPFFVKMNNKVNSSTGAGYLIISKLRDTVYKFTIGFPQDKWPEKEFSLAINRQDHGYLLKDFGEKGWGLFNLQKLTVEMGISNNGSQPSSKSENNSVTPFTEILAKASDDPTLMDKPVRKIKSEKKSEPEDVAKVEKVTAVKVDTVLVEPDKSVVEKIADKDSVVISVNTTVSAIPVEEKVETGIIPDQIKEDYKPSIVKKWSESSTTEGFGLVFIDEISDDSKDTIRLLIPNPAMIEIPVNSNQPKEEKKFVETISTDSTEKKEEIKAIVNPVAQEKTISSPVENKICTAVADETDFLKLRKQMAAAENDEEMINEAKKYYKLKCFTSLQIKNLGVLFLSDEGKYKFFDLSYNNTSDISNFSSLIGELKEEYYINRFRAMLRN